MCQAVLVHIRDEDLLEGFHADPDGGEVMEALWDITIVLVQLAWFIVIKLPIILYRKVTSGDRHV
jgi:hypothetical protein